MTHERLEQLKAYTATWTNPHDKAAMQEALAAITLLRAQVVIGEALLVEVAEGRLDFELNREIEEYLDAVGYDTEKKS